MKTVCLIAVVFGVVACDKWTTPSMMYQCRTNADCDQQQCCVLSPIIKKRQILLDPFYAHTCDGLKNESSDWCMIQSQYSPIARHYTMSCPCKPGLRCKRPDVPMPGYGDRFGKCVKQ
ncbi:U3-aranetoxin-Ce1a-like [Haliotis rubra]|uniref:U3-aranetoxin-Ce1a-like n=1 Tax=Haliotis rubra TaxID=36100 RepID=UPI001EE5FF95|nr:U3-aranetoxin-Ce1a-like [Haliotis rubra]